MMKKFLFASIAAAAIAAAGSAGAADLPVYQARRPVIVPVYNWTGCYIGGYVGGAWDDHNGANFTDLGNARFASFSGGVAAARILPSHSWSADLGNSFIGGGTLGCNWQPFRSPFVLGVEGEFGHLRLSGQAFDPTTIQGTGQTTLDVLGSAKVGDWYGMATGRLGYAWDRIMLYAKGGAAFVPVRASVVDSCLSTAAGCGNWIASTTSGTNVVSTWTIGGGLEWAFATRWSVKAEYMFIGLRDTLTTCGVATVATGNTVPGGPFCFNHQFAGINTAKVGLNYRFW
jgi:outer membrane immunogenic protein